MRSWAARCLAVRKVTQDNRGKKTAGVDGVKNLVWMDSDQLLYQHFRCLPVIKKKVVVEPAGIIDYQPETFRKFFALYLHGAA